MFYTIYDTKYIGDVILYGDGESLFGLEFYKDGFIEDEWIENGDVFKSVVDELDLYFRGELRRFSTKIKLLGSEFGIRVYKELQKIPYGTTISYQELAKRVGNERASRAVGNANGKNPIAIIVPCHRVIAKNGSIGGFSGGVDIKRALLRLEGVKSV